MQGAMRPYASRPERPCTGAGRPMRRADAQVRDDVVRALVLDPWVDEEAIDVRVQGGVVTLEGEVDVTNEKRAAGDDAYETAGVVDVINRLRVRKLERVRRLRRERPGPVLGPSAPLPQGIPGAKPRLR